MRGSQVLVSLCGVVFFTVTLAGFCEGQSNPTPQLESRQEVAPAAPPQPAETEEERRERVTAERFLQLLKRRPRLGTALDRIYGYHIGRGTLDSFCNSLEAEAEKENDGTTWFILGMVQMQRNQDAQAVISLQNAEKLLPQQPLASYYLGKSQVLLGQIDEAADSMRRAVERKPARSDMLAIFQDLGRIYQRTGQTEKALDVWQQLESLFPNDAQVQEEIASILADEGAAEAALERYTKLSNELQDRFRRIEMAIRAAQLKADLGRNDEAIADFEKQLAVVNPDSWLHRDVRRRIEEVFWSTGDVDGLVGYYTNWVETHPEDVDAMMRTARALSVQQRIPEAKKWFQTAIEKAPSNPEIRLALIQTLVSEDEYGEAAKEMQELVDLQPNNPDYIARWGELVFNDTQRDETQRKQEAVEIWQRLTSKRSDDPVTVARLADLLRGVDAVDDAIENYRKAIELAPNEPQYREYLGEYLHQLGRKDEALATWRELARGPRETQENLVRLSEVLSTFRYPEEALEVMAKACGQKPTFGHRARYAELLREAKQYDAALAQLDLAEPMAEDPELREVVISERIKNYQASGTLQERIDDAEAQVAGDGGSDPAAWRLLALLRDAERRFQLACTAISKATELAPGDATMWETAATLQERAGRLGDAVQSYRKLSTLDRRFMTNYLTQIASLELRIGNGDRALEVGEELLAVAGGNSEHYRFYADLCFRLGKNDRGLDALRRNVRSNPNDLDALLHLSKTLASEFQTDEAIELYWRCFDVANGVDEKTSLVEGLTELYLRTNRFESLIDRLEVTAREENRIREGTLLSAAAHQAAGDLGMAKQLLEQLAREDSRDTELLEQLVTLSRAEYDFESAAEYQRRLVAASPTPQNEYALANILLELGELNQAETLWMKLANRRSDPTALTDSISNLVTREQYDTAAAMIKRALEKHPSDWEILSQSMMVSLQQDKLSEALATAEQVLALPVELEEPSAKVKQTLKRRTGRNSAATSVQYDPTANFGRPSRLLQVAAQLNRAIGPMDPRYSSQRRRPFAPACFQDAQAIALAVELLAKKEQTEDYLETIVKDALASEDADQLWHGLFCLAFENPRVQYDPEGGEEFAAILEELIEKRESDAAVLALSRHTNLRRQQSSRNGENTLAPLTDDEISKLSGWMKVASSAANFQLSYVNVMLAVDFARSGKTELANQAIDAFMEGSAGSSGSFVTFLQASTLLLGTGTTFEPDEVTIKRSRDMFIEALDRVRPARAGSSPNRASYSQMYSSSFARLVELGQMDEAMSWLELVLQWQADQVAEMRPSQRDALTGGGAPITYAHIANGQYQQVAVAFPPASGCFGPETIMSLHGTFEQCKDDPAKLKQFRMRVDEWAAEPTEDPYRRIVHLLAKASLDYWAEDFSSASDTLSAAMELGVSGQLIKLAQTRLLFESGKTLEALEVLESLRPSNQRMLVDRELTILQLLLQLGDLDRAKQSAKKLFALRLDSDTELKLADLMYQLGMRDLGERMMGRIQRRAGGRQDTLIQLMTRYASNGDKDAAAEMARQVIRRTSPSSTTNSFTSENRNHQQAVRILAQVGQLTPLIERYEKLVERSPKSTKLTRELAAYYNAAGRREDALKLQLKSAEGASSNPAALYAAGSQLTAAGKHDEAVEKYLAALSKSPAMFERNFYEMETAFSQAKAWDRLAEAMIKSGVEQFATSYRMSSFSRRLMQDEQHEVASRLLVAALKKCNVTEISQFIYGLSNAEFKPNEEVVKLLADRLTDDSSRLLIDSNTFVYSRSSNGRTNSSIDSLASIVTLDDALRKQIVKSMRDRLAQNEEELFARVLLIRVLVNTEQVDEVRDVLQYLIEKEDKNANDAKAIWNIASTLAHVAEQPELACDLLESVKDRSLFGNSGSSFTYTVDALQAFAYGKAGRDDEASKILTDRLLNETVDQSQNQYNPGYGEYQFVRSMSGLAEHFLEIKRPAEAFIAFQRAYGDERMLQLASNYTSSFDRQRERLWQRIQEKTTSDVIRQIVTSAIKPPVHDDGSHSATYGNDSGTDITENEQTDISKLEQNMAGPLTAPRLEERSLIDARVTMLLQDYTDRISDDESLKQAATATLDANPLPDNTETVPLRSLVARLLIADAVGHEQHRLNVSRAILAWSEARPSDTETADDDQAASEDSEASNERTQADRTTTNETDLPEELLLGMAAQWMPRGEISDEQVIRLTQIAISKAEQIGKTSLADSLNCQIAKRISKQDPERARQIFLDALNQILPKAAPQQPAEQEGSS